MGQRLTPRHERQGSCRSPVPLSYVASTLGIHITRDDNAQAPITSEMKARCPPQRGYVGLRPDRCDIQHCGRCCCCRFRCHKAPSAWPSRQSGVAGTAVRPEGVAGTAVRHGRNGSQAELRRCTSISNVALTAVRPDRGVAVMAVRLRGLGKDGTRRIVTRGTPPSGSARHVSRSQTWPLRQSGQVGVAVAAVRLRRLASTAHHH